MHRVRRSHITSQTAPIPTWILTGLLTARLWSLRVTAEDIRTTAVTAIIPTSSSCSSISTHTSVSWWQRKRRLYTTSSIRLIRRTPIPHWYSTLRMPASVRFVLLTTLPVWAMPLWQPRATRFIMRQPTTKITICTSTTCWKIRKKWFLTPLVRVHSRPTRSRRTSSCSLKAASSA